MLIRLIKLEFKVRRWLLRRFEVFFSIRYTRYLLFVNNVEFGSGLVSKGVPVVDVGTGSSVVIGNGFKINNGPTFNRIGRQQPCYLIADYGGKISIGHNVGLSGTAIICHEQISIGNNVLIGGNSVIYDTDFHPLDASKRTSILENRDGIGKKPVLIGDNVFIGGHVTILKGVTIGRNSIVGAGAVVSKDIPANQIWAGNPATFVKAVNQKDSILSVVS